MDRRHDTPRDEQATSERAIATTTPRRSITAADLQELAQAHLDGIASEQDVDILTADEAGWVDALEALRVDVLKTIARLGSTLTGPERDIVIGDFQDELERIDTVLEELTGETPAEPAPVPTPESRMGEARDRTRHRDARGKPQPARGPEPRGSDDTEDSDDSDDEVGTPQLQLSYRDGRVIAWIGGHNVDPEPAERVLELLAEAGAGANWQPHDPVPLPTGQHAQAVCAPIQSSLGWLVSLGDTSGDDRLGASVTWLGIAAALAVRLVAHGRMVPQLEKLSSSGKGDRATFGVRWVPTLIDHDEYSALTKSLPGAVAVLDEQKDQRVVTRTVLSGFVDAICREAASRIEVPAPPPHPRSSSDVAEAVLGRLDGTGFEAPNGSGTEVSRRLQRWAKGVTGASKLQLALQLDPPDEGNAWYLKTLVADGNRKEQRVEPAMSRASDSRREQIKRELERLEGLYAPLERGKHKRRGEVVLSQDEAWELMTATGPILQAAGFEVRVPPLSPKKATAGLKVTSTGPQETVVGAQQLTAVRWTAVFDGVELTAEDIQRLSQESRPLVKAHGGHWVAVDHADLEAAAAALAEREKRDRMTGADMLRYALGLDGSPLPGGISVAGEGWAADLLQSAREIPEDPPTTIEGFEGTLRTYQADAAAWLEFLDSAGLGGCLALDMGLGKTPVMLAHLAVRTERGPALVIAPPAVVGNWASEARRFVPQLDVLVHHGAGRADEQDVAAEVAKADVLLTTYQTAVRDIEALEDIRWGKIVLDEAQVIKNPASETAQQLRRLEAHNKIVLTGTPIENGLGDLWALMDFVNPGLLGDRASFVAQLSKEKAGRGSNEQALRTLNGVLVFRRTKAEPAIAEELPDRIDELDHCPMTTEQIGLYQAVLDDLTVQDTDEPTQRKGAVLAAITALKQICNHPAAYTHDEGPLAGRSGKLTRLEEIVDNVFEAGEKVLVFTHFATWGERLAAHLRERTGKPIGCYHGGLSRGARDEMVRRFQTSEGPDALVLSLKAGGTGLNLTAASHVVLYDRWWNPAVEDQARDRAWRIGQTRTVVAHRLVCPGTVDERVEEVVQGKRRIADIALPKSSSVGDLDRDQLQRALGIDPATVLTEDTDDTPTTGEAA